MAIKVDFKVEGDVLYVTATGKDESVKEVLAYGQSVMEQALLNQSKRILVNEFDLVYAIGTFDLYATAKALAENAPRVAKTALVVDPNQYQDAKFWETVAVNRGIFVRLFSTIEEAKQWLEIS